MTPTSGRYALLNARNRVASLEYERDHPDEFDHQHNSLRHADGTVVSTLEGPIAKARAKLVRLEREAATADGRATLSPTPQDERTVPR